MNRYSAPKQPPTPAASAALRRQAEERLSEQQERRRSQGGCQQSEAESRRAVHELEVHQIELEMQNEELRKTREDVESLLEKFSDLYDFAPVGYLTLDPEGAISEANLTAASLLGVDRSDLIHRRFESFVSTADRPGFDAFLNAAFETQTKPLCEVSLPRDGTRPLHLRLEATAAGRECRVALTDITERKQAEEKRLILSKLESTGILAGGIAHDFNNLLTVILLNLELARKLALPGDELARRLEEATKAALTSRSLTQQLIMFAKGGAPIRKPTRLADLIRESVLLALSGSRVRCEFSLPEDLWPAEVDAGQIGQVVRNMVQNAREAMTEGGIITVDAANVALDDHEHPILPRGDYVRVGIDDTGEGVAKETLPKIFDPYFSTKQRGDVKGMGLGLTICHTVIQKHGGAITVESEAGVGTTFHILLPAARYWSCTTKAVAPRILPRPGRILAMDDDEAMRYVIETALQQMGHEVELAEDGEAAVDAYIRARSQDRPFDAVLLDLTVRAGVGGKEAVRTLLQEDPAVKAMVMSGYANDPVVVDPEKHGFKGVLLKPFDIAELQELLARIMKPEENDQ